MKPEHDEFMQMLSAAGWVAASIGAVLLCALPAIFHN